MYSFFPNSISHWNKLPPTIDNIVDLNNFQNFFTIILVTNRIYLFLYLDIVLYSNLLRFTIITNNNKGTIVLNSRDQQGMYGMQNFRAFINPYNRLKRIGTAVIMLLHLLSKAKSRLFQSIMNHMDFICRPASLP